MSPASPRSAAVLPEAQPYVGGSGPHGVLLVHGFTGSPHALRPWAQHLEAAGFRVVVPRLPGHGTTWQELNRTRWTDWYDALDQAFVELSRSCERVGVAGLSTGGALALRLAQQHGDAVAALSLVNPCIAIADPRIRLSRLFSVRPALRALHSETHLWADVREHLDRVHQPLLVHWSRQDHLVDPSSLALIRRGVASTEVDIVVLERSYHVATLDHDAELIFHGSTDFFRRHLGARG